MSDIIILPNIIMTILKVIGWRGPATFHENSTFRFHLLCSYPLCLINTKLNTMIIYHMHFLIVKKYMLSHTIVIKENKVSIR